MSEQKTRDYAIGFGKPPRHTQFKPGQSGNPRGRSKGARSLASDIDEALNDKIAVRENGRHLKLRKQAVMVKALMNKAVQGDVKAIQYLVANSHQLRECAADEPQQLGAIDRLILDEFVKARTTKDQA